MMLIKRSPENGDPVFMRVREVMIGIVAFKNRRIKDVKGSRKEHCILLALTERH